MAVEGQSNFVYNPPKEGEFDFPSWSNSMLSVDENENISFLGVIPIYLVPRGIEIILFR